MTALTALPSFAVVEFETEHYTDWKCAVCGIWRERHFPALIVRKTSGETVRCREHGSPSDDADDEKCLCHCHEMGVCDECGEESGER